MDSVSRFLNEDGQVKQWPKKRADKQLVLAYLAGKFEFSRSYHEREVNEIVKKRHTLSDLMERGG